MRERVLLVCGPFLLLSALAGSPLSGAALPEDVGWCPAEKLLEERLSVDPGLRQRREAAEQARLARSSFPKQSSLLVVPTVVHVVHLPGTSVGTAENLSYAQIQSQLAALNRDLEGQLNTGAVDTAIRFCLAKLPPSGPWPNPAEPGVTRHPSALTNHNLSTDEAALKLLGAFPPDRYVNIWVVKLIQPLGVVGYAQFPGTVPAALDGIVMRYDAFGSNLLPPNGSFQLLPVNQDGKILAHEVGHYLDLFHTFHGGCLGAGDLLADTPPEETPAFDCPIGRSTCGFVDPIENFMDYTDDTCRVAFSPLQAQRMRDTILIFRSSLVDSANLVSTGCVNGALPTIQVDVEQVCTGQAVTFSTVSVAAEYEWSFPGGTPATATGKGPHVVSYASAGVYDVSLTTNNAGNTDPRSLTRADLVYVTACSPIASGQGNWYFGTKAGLSFASGQPVAVLDGELVSSEAAVTQSDAAGNLLFYSDSINVWNGAHALMNPTQPLKGHTSNTQGTISVPDPANSKRFYLFTIDNDNGGGRLFYTRVDMTSSAGVLTNINTQVALPAGARVAEQVTAVPQCNGVDYWLIVHGWGNVFSPTQQFLNDFYVYSITANGVSGPQIYAVALKGRYGSLKSSPDGSMLAQCAIEPSTVSGTGLFGFDRTTGAITLRANLSHGNYGCSFSPDSRVLYVADYAVNNQSAIYQYDVEATNPDTTAVLVAQVPSNTPCGLQLGPDQRIYCSTRGSAGTGRGFLSVIHFPNQRNTLAAPNACGFKLNGPGLGGRLSDIGLPNMIDARPGLVPADFDFSVSACSQVAFHARNCGASFSWSFGDGGSSTQRDPTHAYASPGTYSAQLTVTSGAGTTTVTKQVKVGIAPVSISGPLDACAVPSNYSVNASPGVSYQWQVSGGTPTATTGNNIDVVWGASGGSVSVMASDPATGCQAAATLPVGRCGVGCRPGGNPCPTCQSTWEAACKSPGTATAAVTICNNSTTPQVYAWSLAGTPIVPNTACTVEGPTQFAPASGQVTVAPGPCSTTLVSVTCPGGQPEGAHGCFQLKVVDVNSGGAAICSGSTLIARRWLGRPTNLFYDVAFGTSADVSFTVTNLQPFAAVLPYELSVMPSDMLPAEPIARLDDCDPGGHVRGSLAVAAGASEQVSVNVSFTTPQPFAPQDLLFSADLNGNGGYDVIASAGLRSSILDCNANGVADALDVSAGTSTDCNANLIPDECDLAAGTVDDCNGNQVIDSCEVAAGSVPDVNVNGIPDSCEIVTLSWVFSGTAQGGQISAAVQGPSALCTVTVATVAGESPATVVSHLAAALNAAVCLTAQNITASALGTKLSLSGFALTFADVSFAITDPGLSHLLVAVPIPSLSSWALFLMAGLLSVIGWRFIVRP